jgi:hypothetical protein
MKWQNQVLQYSRGVAYPTIISYLYACLVLFSQSHPGDPHGFALQPEVLSRVRP